MRIILVDIYRPRNTSIKIMNTDFEKTWKQLEANNWKLELSETLISNNIMKSILNIEKMRINVCLFHMDS